MIRLNVFIQVEESNRNEVIEVAKETGRPIPERQRVHRLRHFRKRDTQKHLYDLRNMER